MGIFRLKKKDVGGENKIAAGSKEINRVQVSLKLVVQRVELDERCEVKNSCVLPYAMQLHYKTPCHSIVVAKMFWLEQFFDTFTQEKYSCGL